MADERPADEHQDRRALYNDVWGSPPDEGFLAGPKDSGEMPPLVERGPDQGRLEQLERSLREARSEIEDLRSSVRELTTTIERIAHRLQMSGYTEST